MPAFLEWATPAVQLEGCGIFLLPAATRTARARTLITHWEVNVKDSLYFYKLYLTLQNTHYSGSQPLGATGFSKANKFSSLPRTLMQKKADGVGANWLGARPRNADREAGRVAGECQRCRDLNVHLFQPVYRRRPRVSRGQIHLAPD